MNTNDIEVVLTIPAIGREQRIGSVLNHVCQVMYQMENTNTESNRRIVWDFGKCSFLHPYLLGALSVLKRMYGDVVVCRNIPANIVDYLNVIYFHEPLSVIDDCNNDDLWNRYHGKTYLPICEFNPKDKSSIKAQELVQSTVRNQLGGNMHSVLSYMLSELIDNITDHSHSPRGYIFCQTIPRQNILYVFIADVGRSIYSSYASDPRYMEQLDNSESSALLLALSGKSTKNRPESENRGYGISKTRELVVNGLGGEFFLLSGSAFARHDAGGEIIADLPGDLRWNGTIALLKIPTVMPPQFNIYNYIS
jgi:anti-sigma regulatory factor (Ser/Thr protein kinase)